MAGYICPECGVDLSKLNEDIYAHAVSHWGSGPDYALSKEGVERRKAMFDAAAKEKK